MKRWLTTLFALLPLLLATPVQADTDLDDLARELDRNESIRAVKLLQNSYAQYAQYGLWNAAGELFAEDGSFVFDGLVQPAQTAAGPAAIADFLRTRYGGGREGLRADGLSSMFIESPIVNLSEDGESAKGRWQVMIFHGHEGEARIEGGVFNVDYARDRDDDGVVEIGGMGLWTGKTGVRKWLDSIGAAGLSHGQLNDQLQNNVIVTIAPGRFRLFQPRTGKEVGEAGAFFGASFWGGMYHNRYILENGIWRIWELTLDEPYITAVAWKDGVRAKARDPENPRRWGGGNSDVDIPLSALVRREMNLPGGTGESLQWPSILPMWFSYSNPVSGREPEFYHPDCVPCELRPDLRLEANGYQEPPDAPMANRSPDR